MKRLTSIADIIVSNLTKKGLILIFLIYLSHATACTYCYFSSSVLIFTTYS